MTLSWPRLKSKEVENQPSKPLPTPVRTSEKLPEPKHSPHQHSLRKGVSRLWECSICSTMSDDAKLFDEIPCERTPSLSPASTAASSKAPSTGFSTPSTKSDLRDQLELEQRKLARLKELIQQQKMYEDLLKRRRLSPSPASLANSTASPAGQNLKCSVLLDVHFLYKLTTPRLCHGQPGYAGSRSNYWS